MWIFITLPRYGTEAMVSMNSLEKYPCERRIRYFFTIDFPIDTKIQHLESTM